MVNRGLGFKGKVFIIISISTAILLVQDQITYYPIAQTMERMKTLEQELIQRHYPSFYDQITVQNVPIDDAGNEWIHTMICGQENTINLLLIHGYGGTGLFFLDMLRELSQYYRVFAIDLYGMGLSSHPRFTITGEDETINFFVDSIERWRQKLQIDEMEIAGHSFGGFVAGWYAIYHQNRVTKLHFISPAGVSDKGDSEEQWNRLVEEQSFFSKRKLALKIMGWVFDKRVDPFEGARKLGFVGRYMMKKFVLSKYNKIIPDEEGREKIVEYYENLVQLPQSSEQGFFNLFGKLVISKKPLEAPLVEHLDIPITFYYGTVDWMDFTGALKVRENYTKNDCKVVWVEKAGHNIIFDNPKALIGFITQDFIETHGMIKTAPKESIKKTVLVSQNL
eukprot:TRINITY_DN725_c0_g1_i10.p1 TRINITY_DN725_c0_g1~~TRINITY_DN725_c0_g1_i10.p1  ORF type:complete len:393 (-),score=77.80 TRINITY_DN725_c0_g1_i10:235-1413(-)